MVCIIGLNSRVQVFSRVCTCIPYRRALSGGRCRGSSATPFQFILITDRQPHPTIYRRWPSFSGRCCSCLEQSAWSCHFRTFLSCFPVPFSVFQSRLKTHLFNISYPSPLWLRSDALVAFGHYNRSCLLTYLLTQLAFDILLINSVKAHTQWV